MHVIRLLSAAFLACITPASLWAAEAYPAKPIRIIFPFEPGGGGDVLARTISPGLTENLGQPVYIDYRTGAGGIVGIEAGARAPADGYNLLLVPGTLTILPSLVNTRYDPVKDFAPITQITRQPYVLVVHPSLPVRSVKDLIALAKSKPGQIDYGSQGTGNGGHLAAELFKTMARVDMVHIPYKGSGPALTALLGGHVQLVFGNIISVMPHTRGGRLRAIAVTGAQPSPAVPGVQTIAEAGLPGYEISNWIGMVAPASTPPAIVTRVHTAILASLTGVRARLVADGSEVVGNSPAEFAEFIKHDVPKWKKLIQASGAKAD